MRKKLWISVVTLVVVGAALAGWLAYHNPTKNNKVTPQSHPTYSLNLTSGKSYAASEPVQLNFAIQDQNGTVLKAFDTVHEKRLHLIVVRTDRTNFQHVHPALNQANGMFALSSFKFPTDGVYRVFADFTASNSQMGPGGMKLATTPYQDVQVGDVSKYTPQTLDSDKLTSSVNGLSTNLQLLSDDNPGANFISGVPLNLGINIDKAGAPYKSLENYLGALGHMVILGPKLEFIHAHALTESTTNQTGLIVFQTTFQEPGQFKLYLQTQAEGRVNTTDYTITVKPNPSGTSSSNSSMQGMQHMSH